jgi:endoribonuclease LACTB2
MEQTSKRLFYQKLRDFIYHIPGENPSQFTLCGTNCFVVGRGPKRVMIEAGDYPERNTLFLENFGRFLTDFKGVSIDRIFITHGHFDHFGGVMDVLNLMREMRE